MMSKKVSFLIILSLFLSAVPFAKAKSADKTKPSMIRVTPPAPRFTDAERQTELAARRARVFAEMADKSIMILFSAEPRLYTNDVDYVFRQENNLYYLTNLKQGGATLVLVKNGGATQEILFLPKRNPQFETWNGRMYANEEAARISGVNTIVDAKEWDAFFAAIREKKSFESKDKSFSFSTSADNLYFLTLQYGFEMDDVREYQREWKLANEFAKVSVDEKTNQIKYEPLLGYKILNATPIFGKLRLIKSPYEIRLLQHAIDITTEAQMRAMATAKQVRWEYEAQAEIEYVFRKRNADFWGYPSIVGCGPNATTLHYVESQNEIRSGELLLTDAGAEYDHYTADVTRTFPVNGKFTKEQAEIYQIVYDAQEAAAKTIKPNSKLSEASAAARRTVEEGLVKLGLITAVGAFIPGTEKQVDDGKGGKKTIGTPQSFIWYMHGLGHWLGMNVHDAGQSAVYQPGMVMTIEPGVYIREDALDYFDTKVPGMTEFLDKIRPAAQKYKNIGVRIEDDMLVTPTGVEWMTKNLPRRLDEVENFVAKASKQINVARSETNIIPSPAFFETGANLPPTALTNADFLNMTNPLNGKTVRRGWIWAGKNTAYSSLSHSD